MRRLLPYYHFARSLPAKSLTKHKFDGHFMSASHLGFTLLELLIVIGVLGILATALILVLNPLEFFKQSRDARRITDLKAINSALGIATIEGLPLGTAGTVYVSIPDTSATCANLGLPALPTGYVYACSTETNYMKANGTGWIPVNLTALSTRSPLSRLPTDPVNTTSTGYYYTYVMGGSYALTSTLESDKLLKQTALNDGGYDPGRYEVGSDLKLVARQEGLAGWWTFDEGSGTTAGDGSGNGNTGTLVNSPTWTTGKMGGALSFDGASRYINLGAGKFDTLSNATIMMWFKYSGTFDNNYLLFSHTKASAPQNMFVSYPGGYGNKLVYEYWGFGPAVLSASSISAGQFYFVAHTCGTNGAKLYLNNALEYSDSFTGCLSASAPSTANAISGDFNGIIDDVRIYNRALSAAEITAIYNATK